MMMMNDRSTNIPTLGKLNHKNYLITDLVFFSTKLVKMQEFFMTSPAPVSNFRIFQGLKNASMNFRAFQDPWER